MRLQLNNPLITVGIPTFNQPKALKQTLNLICNQTYKNLEIIISDNGSDGNEVSNVIKSFKEKDIRIIYFQQLENKGVNFNFRFVLEKANGSFFMWAADDYWEPDFIEICYNNLLKFNVGVSFSNIHAIDIFGRTLRRIENLSKISKQNKFSTVKAYLFSPEIEGKANIIYGLYPKYVISETLNTFYKHFNYWGIDMNMNLYVISHYGCYIDQRVLFKKMGTDAEYSKQHFEPIIFKNPKDHIFPEDKFDEYIYGIKLATKGTKMYYLAIFIMYYRLYELKTRKLYKRIKIKVGL